MKVVFDNNVIIDALKPNPQFEVNAQQILRLASIKKIDGFVSANSLAAALRLHRNILIYTKKSKHFLTLFRIEIDFIL